MGGSTKVVAPQPSAAEIALQQQQASLLAEQQRILKQQAANQTAMMQFAATQHNLKIKFDSAGNIIGIDDLDPQAAEDKARSQEIQRLHDERSLKALRGELEVDPTLERNLESQEQTLRERLQQQFGAGYETASPAIEALDQFMQSAESLRYGARTGQLTLSEQLSLARQNANQASSANTVESIFSSTLGQQLGLAGAYGSLAGQYGAAQQPYQFTRNMQFNASAQNAQSANNMWGGIGQLAGTLGSAFMFSDRELKDNIQKVADTLWGAGIYLYNLKGSTVRRLGMMADEIAQHRPDAVMVRDGHMVVNYGAL